MVQDQLVASAIVQDQLVASVVPVYMARLLGVSSHHL